MRAPCTDDVLDWLNLSDSSNAKCILIAADLGQLVRTDSMNTLQRLQKLAVNPAGAIAVASSTFQANESSHVWQFPAQLDLE